MITIQLLNDTPIPIYILHWTALYYYKAVLLFGSSCLNIGPSCVTFRSTNKWLFVQITLWYDTSLRLFIYENNWIKYTNKWHTSKTIKDLNKCDLKYYGKNLILFSKKFISTLALFRDKQTKIKIKC